MKGFGKEKVVVLASWFLAVIGFRILLGTFLSNMWLGTLGAVAITFAVFYVALSYSPLKRYSAAVDLALRSWYSRRFVLCGLIVSTIVLISLMTFGELGYTYFSDELLSLSERESMNLANRQISSSVSAMLASGYSSVDVMSITIASVDKTLSGYYLLSVNYLLIENMEIIGFLILLRYAAGRNIFLFAKRW